jgi:hypothetical protein
MTTDKKIQTTEEYINSVHRLGRIGAGLAAIIMMSMPVIAGIYFNAMPSLGQIIAASAGLLAIFLPIGISELISYTPVLGSSIYLTLVTGNVMNLKLPVANNAMKLLDLQSGSEEADVISNIAVSVSTFFTLLILAVGVLLMVPLQPVLTLAPVRTAITYVLPALFGSMALGIFSNHIGGGIRTPGRMKGAIVPAIIVLVITLLDKFVLKTGLISSMQGVLILLMLPITYFGTKMLYKKGQIKVLLPGEGEEKKE